ncbi:MAG: hypothetical protein HYT79_10810 [Elusimicrobia bacterium]|nr:hypothetical protein [Elusimicrobiota bacterium]
MAGIPAFLFLLTLAAGPVGAQLPMDRSCTPREMTFRPIMINPSAPESSTATTTTQEATSTPSQGDHRRLEETFDRGGCGQGRVNPPLNSVNSSSSTGQANAVDAIRVQINQSTSTQPAANAAIKNTKEQVQGPTFFSFISRLFNSIANLVKLAIVAPLSIISNVIEGIVSGIGAIFTGDIVHALTWPFKTVINAAWNTVAMAANAASIALDPFWHLGRPQDPAADVYMVGLGPRIRTVVAGGPLGAANLLFGQKEETDYFVFSSAFIQTREHRSYEETEGNRDVLAHEFGHTQQAQNSFMVDLAVRRGITDPEGVEREADEIGEEIEDDIWIYR